MKHSIWHFDLFGGLRAVRLDQSEALPIENFRTQKAASLLAFLAFYRQAHRREVLAEMFWPDAEPLKARNSLRVALSGLRELLEVDIRPESSALVIKRESLAIAPNVSTDVGRFRAQLQDAHFEIIPEIRLQKLESAIDLVRGPLLRGFYDDWISGEAARLEDEFLSALRQIITTYETNRELSKALDVARRGTIAAPLREGVVRDLVRLGVACGQEDNVKAEFEAYRRRVERVRGALPVDWPEFLRRATQTNTQRNSLSGAVSRQAQSQKSKPSTPATSPDTPISTSLSPSPRAVTWYPTLEGIKPMPRTSSSFIGRERDIEALNQLLESPATRLVTITGPGGAGKTRLAQETAYFLTTPGSEEPQTALPFGAAIWLPLASLPSSRLLAGSLLDAIGAPALHEDIESVAHALQQLSQVLKPPGGKTQLVAPRMLLLVDNCEHLEKSAAQFIDAILARVPTLTVLATSRSTLGLGGEHTYQLASLDARPQSDSLYDLPSSRVKAQMAAPSDAVRLFVERAHQASPDFRLTVSNTSLLTQICERLDGLPLAIEIVAARVSQFTPEQIAVGLGVTSSPGDLLDEESSASLTNLDGSIAEEALAALSQGVAPDADALIRSLGLLDWSNPNPQAPTRHSSLRAAIEWSAEQLSPAVARFWARLSVFPESFSLEAAIEVCQEPYASVYLQTLRDASLLSVAQPVLSSSFNANLEGARESARLSWLHPLYEFASDLLSQEEKDLLRERHAQYFLRWVLQMRMLLDNPSNTRERRLLNAESVNLRAASQWLLEHDVEAALRLANALSWHWEQSGHMTEGRLELETALELSKGIYAEIEAQVRNSPSASEGSNSDSLDIKTQQARARLRERAQALEAAGKLANMASDHETVRSHLIEALRLFRILNDEIGIAGCIYAMGFNALRRGDHVNAKKLCQESLEITRKLDNPAVLSDALYNLSMVSLMSGDFAAVRQLSGERLALCRTLGDRRGLATSLENLGLASLFEGDGEAATYFSECLTAFEALEDTPSVTRALWGLGQVALYNNRWQEARDYFSRASALTRTTQTVWTIPYLLEAFAALAVGQKQWRRAAVLLGGAASLRERQSEPLPSPFHQEEFEQMRLTTREALGEAIFNERWQTGRALSAPQLLNLAESSGDS